MIIMRHNTFLDSCFFSFVNCAWCLFFWQQLLKEKGLLPELNLQIDDIVCALDEDLQGCAAMVANILREKGQIVELVLESKPLKWYNFFFIIFVPFLKAYLNILQVFWYGILL